MKKWWILIIVIVAVALVNLGYLYWAEKNQGDLVVTKEGEIKSGWENFSDLGVSFDVPQGYISENSLTGQYWFEPKNNKVAIVYEKFDRDQDLTLEDQIKENILEPEKCLEQSVKDSFTIYEQCPYLSTIYTFVAFEKNDKIGIITLDHKILADKNIDYIVSSLK